MSRWRSAYAFLNVDDPVIAWLIYRGELASAPRVHERALSVWATRRLRAHGYDHELDLERMRQRHFPGLVSRLTGFYAFPERSSALAAEERWPVPAFRRELLAEIAINPSSRVSRYDAEWITEHLGSPEIGWMHRYFRGCATARPIWELLVDGRALVMGAELRERAYATIKETWPASLALLELARLGVALGSDLGAITAMVFRRDHSFTVEYAMNFVDATNPVFLERFAKFDGPKNTGDLTPASRLITPDLRSRGFVLT